MPLKRLDAVWFEILKGCMFVYVPDEAGKKKAGHKMTVKRALGVGGGGEEWLKT